MVGFYALLSGDGTCFNENYFFPKKKKEKRVVETTLLAKQYKCILPAFLLLFVSSNGILYYITHYDTIFNQLNIKVKCFSDAETKPQWFILFRLLIVGASFSMMCATSLRLIFALMKKGCNEYIVRAYLSALLVMTVSFITECIYHLGIFSTVCEDAFGVRSPMIEVSEWIVTVPMMIYMNITLDVKKKEIEHKDKLLVIAAYLNIFFGFLPILLNEAIASLSIAFSGLCMIYYLYCIVADASMAVAKYHNQDSKSFHIHAYVDYLFAHKRLVTAMLMAMIFPMYPVTYLLSAGKVFDHIIISAVFAALNFLAKCCFILALMEDQLDVLDPKALAILFDKKDYVEAVKVLEKEKKLNISLLRQVFPARVVDDLRSQRPVPAMTHPSVTIFFSDIEGFTLISSQVPALRVMKLLHELYSVMDYCAHLFPTYKVETIGDAFMLCGGIFNDPEKDKDHFQHIANFAILVQACAAIVKNPLNGEPIRLRMGIHSGMVKSGCVGSKMPRFCLFGDTVNTASRMESHGEVNKIHCSEATAALLAPTGLFDVSRRGLIEVKGKGKMTTYWINGASSNNQMANRSAIQKAIENSQLILESSVFVSDSDINAITSTNSIPDESIKSPKGSFSMSHFLSGKKENKPSPVKVPSQSPFITTVNSESPKAPSYESQKAPSYESRPLMPNRSRSRLDLMNVNRQADVDIVKNTAIETVGRPNFLYVDCDLSKIVAFEKLIKAINKKSKVVFAQHAEEALEKLKVLNSNVDVIIVAEQLSLDGFLGHEFVEVIRNNLALRSSVIVGLCSDPANVKDEMTQFIRAGADSFWVQLQKDPKVCMREILEKWLLRNVHLNMNELNMNQLLAEIIMLIDDPQDDANTLKMSR